MYCPKCGEQNDDGNKFCKSCGATLTQESPPSRPEPVPVAVREVAATRTSGLSVAALVLGIIGIFINFLGILAIIFGAIGVSQTGKDPTLGGRGMAIAGLVLGIVAIAIWIIAVIFWSTAFTVFF